MKTKYIILPFIVFFSMTFMSCEDMLTENPKSFTTAENFFRSPQECEAAANGCYQNLYKVFNQNLLLFLEGATDLAYIGASSYADNVFGLSPSSPGAADNLWGPLYEGVRICNAAIAGLKTSPVEEKVRNKYLAEALFLRGMYYYVLTSMFGDVPFYTDNVNSLAVLERVAKLPRMSAVATRDSLLNEMERYVDYLPIVNPQSGDVSTIPNKKYYRISRQALHMLISKMAMWNHQYERAQKHLLKIRSIYGSLSQYPLSDTKFSEKNKPESIFEVQYTWSPTGLKISTTVACFFTPSKLDKTDIFDGVSIPYLGTKSTSYTSVTPSRYFLDLYEQVKSDLDPETDFIDPRSRIILGYEYGGTVFNRVGKGGKPWMGPKFWCPAMDNVADGNNQKVFRFADALLLLAECAVELNNPDLAIECLKEVRSRARYVKFFTESDPIALRQEIRDERARELMGDYTRKFDLVRWGIFFEQLKMTVATEVPLIETNLRPYHQYHPIPDVEVKNTNGILTNDAYTGN